VPDYIEANVRRTNRNLFVTNFILLLGVFVVAWLSSRYLYNALNGPFAMDREALFAVRNPDDLERYFVTVDGDNAIDTGKDEITATYSKGVKTGEYVSGHYVGLAFGRKMLLVKAPPDGDYTLTTLTGALQPISSDVQVHVLDDLELHDYNLQDAFLPFMLDAAGDFRTGAYVELVAGALIGGLAIWNLVKFLQRNANPYAHPVYKALSAFGPAESVAASVNAEVAGPRAATLGTTVITPHWLLRRGPFRIDVVHLDDLVWVYKKVTRSRSGRIYTAVLCTKQGRQVVIATMEARVDQIVTTLAQRAPWAYVDYTAQRAKEWKTNRQAMIQNAADKQREMRTEATSE
jgi:hypothetical protein